VAIQASRDPFTIEILDKIGVAEGWHCAEIGAGAGSMTEWLCRKVGQSGEVLATDREIKLLETIEADNLTVRKHGVASDDLEIRAFDLLLTRKVLEHVREPVAA
jgi:tRNA A58 N-methylase Trm61